MNYSTLVGAKTLPGSIKRAVNYSQIDAEVVLEEAQLLIYESLRVREMRALWSPTVAIGDSTKALPADWLDPLGRMRDTRNMRYVPLTEDNLLSRRCYDAQGVLMSGPPRFYCVLDEAIQFDYRFDTASTLFVPYYKQPELLSASNETNFLTRRYAHLLRQACTVRAHSFMKSWSAYQAELGLLGPMIDMANSRSDLSYRDTDFDTELG